ncbi:hypothetical protein WJX75_005520 [Coccomyxa subellipsoidea]|uniref:DUF3730 domain-containing protein n=1 Tax=Coccomyxa subellipsoidea TaxID=248742 RepID=A0ABR2YI84_9CHLO
MFSSKNKVVVEEAVDQLVAFVPKSDLSISDAAGLLLASLSNSDAATVPPLVDGLVELFKKQAENGSQPIASWQAHLLSKTLSAHPEASYQLLHCIELLLLELGDDVTETEPALWMHLRPFLSFTLLDYGPQGERLTFAVSLHSVLCRASFLSPVLELLASHVACLPLATVQQRIFARQGNLPLKLGVLLSPIIHTLVFDAPPLAKEKANELLHMLRLPADIEDESAANRDTARLEDAVRFERADLRWGLCALHTSCCSLLTHFFSNRGGEALRWLRSMRASLQQAAAAKSGALHIAAAPHLAAFPSDNAQPSLSGPMVMALPALLCHPETAVQVEAACTLAEAVKAVPLLGISFLPLIVYHLQSSAGSDKGTMTQAGREDAVRLEAALVEAIPAMAVHSAALPFVNRALVQLPLTGSPEATQARLLRLRTQLWLGSGHGFNALSDALLGTGAEIPSKQQRDSVELRVTRAQCLLAVCAQDVGKGYQLLEGIEGCLGSDLEEEAALALEAMAVLVERDGLKFQKAWAAVQRRSPSLPDQAPVAAAWLLLLGHAHRDAEKHPEQFGTFHDALWQATAHPIPQVRAAAYTALARYPFETLELLELARPLQQYSCLLLQERDESALAACEGLVTAALSHEHARRRRYVGVAAKGPSGGGQKAEDPLMRRLTKVLPKQLCRAAAGSSSGAASPGALLLCWAPLAPPPDSDTTPAQHAHQAAAAYRARLGEIAAAGPATAGNSAASSDLVFHSWKRFLSRWMGALKAAAQTNDSASLEEAVTIAAGEEVWEAILQVRREGTAPAPDEAIYAAGALCSLLQDRAKHLCAAILNKLQDWILSPTSAVSMRACLLAVGAASGVDQTRAHSLVSLFLSNHSASRRAAAAEAYGASCTWNLFPEDMVTTGSDDAREIAGIMTGIAGVVLHAANVSEDSSRGRILAALFGDCMTSLAEISYSPPACNPASEGICIVMPALVTAMLSMRMKSRYQVELILTKLHMAAIGHYLPGTVVGAAATALGCLVAGLAPDQAQAEAQRTVDALLTALGNAPQLAQSGAAKFGVAAGLAVMLGAPHLLSGVPPAGTPAFLASPENAEAAKQALQTLEALALKEADPQVRRAAAWALAAATIAARSGPSPGVADRPGASADVRALQSLPEEGSMRSLLQYALNAANQPGDPACSAAMLHCLATAEKLPAINVGAMCGSFLQQAHATPSLQEAAVGLALRHPELPGDLLEGLLQQSRFPSLALRLRMQLLSGLSSAVSALSATRSVALVASLPQLCRCSRDGRASAGEEDLQLQVAAWHGLQGVLDAAEASGSSSSRGLALSSDLSDAVYQAMHGLLELLPSPPATLPGEEIDMEIGERSCTSKAPLLADTQLETQSARSSLVLWTAVLQCLKAADAEKVLSLLPCLEDSAVAAGQVFARGMLVRWGAVPLTELQPCRTWCIRSRPVVAGPVMATVARSTAAMPHTQKQQLLMECLDLVTVCEHPAQAFSMAALLAATWRAQLNSDPGETHVTAQSPSAGAAALPYALPSLLEHPQWRPAADAAAHRLAAVVDHAAGSTMVQYEVLGKGAMFVPLLEIARACIIGMRNLLTPPAWKHVSAMALHVT